MAEDVIAKKEAESLFKKQSQAAALTPEERHAVADINLNTLDPLKNKALAPIPEDIQDLLKKQGVAGTAGHPQLTPEEMERIRDFNASRM